MKCKQLPILLALVALVIFSSATRILAQNEMIVQWDDGSGNIVQDALYNAVMGDTVAGGARANLDRIYVLKAGGYYWNNKTISNNFPLQLIGEEPTGDAHPAVVQMVTDQTSGATPGKMISCADALTLKNLYLIGSDELGSSGYYQPIEVNAVGKRFIIDNCVFERSNFAIVAFAGGSDNDLFITNCVYRNLQEDVPTQQWCGRSLSVWTDIDTVIIENNTFFNVNMCAIQIENGAANYLRFNHNTLVNIGRAFTSTTNVWWQEAYFANNLLVNVWWHGEGLCDYGLTYAPGRDPRAYTTGQFPIVDMPSRYGTNKGRRILFANTAAYLDPFFTTHYGDTIRTQPFVNAIT
ncbi:MAG: right-handed parallel beta-helix repeat-containing protein, partial [Candidatus Neomarinimicrobiota bacterium]